MLLCFVCQQVASEDTVLYTAQAYADNLAKAGCDAHQAVDRLAPLVRCPHLSQQWLSALVLSDDADKLLGGMQRQLKRLLPLKVACMFEGRLSRTDIKAIVPDVPASWLLPVRDIQASTITSMQWDLDVAAIRQAAQDSAQQRRSITLKLPTNCFLGGISWGLELVAYHSSKGTITGVYKRAKSLPLGSLCRCTYSVECVDVAALDFSFIDQQCKLFHNMAMTGAWGWRDYFNLAPCLVGLMRRPGLPRSCQRLGASSCD
jgi:hypothetical protein